MDAAVMIPRVAALADALLARRWRLATAESCTGGLIAAHCTAVLPDSHDHAKALTNAVGNLHANHGHTAVWLK